MFTSKGLATLLVVLLVWSVSSVAQWEQVNEDGFGIGSNSTFSMAVMNDVLYAGTGNPGGLFRLGNPTAPSLIAWQEVDLPVGEVSGAGDDFELETILCMSIYTPPHERWPWLYIAVHGSVEGESDSLTFVLRSQTGYTWELASEVWNYRTYGEIHDMAVFDEWLYVGFGDTQRVHEEFFRILRTNGSTWEETVSSDDISLGTGDWYFGRFEVFDGYLYAGTAGLNESEDPTRTAEIWRTPNGTSWTKVGELSSPTMAEIESMEVFDGDLYVGTKSHAVAEERTGPEIWRYDGSDWTNLSAERRSFSRESVHLDILYARHGILYAATGGGPIESPYTRLYRSLDGERWEGITPEGISGHPEEDNYATGAIVGLGEYLFLGTALNHLSTGTEVWRLAELRTDVGPCVAQHDGEAYLLQRLPSPGENILETVYRDDELIALGPIYDQDVARTWALTNKQPVAYGYDFMGLLVGSRYLQLVYRDNDSDVIWQTRKSCPDGRHWYWETPEVVEGAHTNRAPGATAHNWSGPSGPQLTVAYTDPDTGRIHFRVKEGTRWSAEYTLPEEARTSNGPEIVSFGGSLYVFYRGYGDDDWLHVAKKATNLPSGTRWEISRLSRAFTRSSGTDRAVSAVAYDGALVVAYVGHNNDYLWLRRSTDGETWDRLGYIRGPVSDHNPDLSAAGGTLYLAFKPTGDQEVCFGTLELDPENEHDTPGHIWRSLRPMACCPDCILTILDIVIPLFPVDD